MYIDSLVKYDTDVSYSTFFNLTGKTTIQYNIPDINVFGNIFVHTAYLVKYL